MIRPLRILIALAAICAGLLIGPVTSQAADPSCSIHDLQVTGWTIQGDYATTSWDFKCGGALNWDYYLQLAFQWRDSGGAWHTFDCDNGNLCRVTRPTSGLYNGGDRHNGTNQWNIAGALDCHTIRFHATAFFPGSGGSGTDFDNFNSATYQIGGC